MFRKTVLVVSLVAVLVGVVPQSRAQAFAPPIPIAPPITGLCATPWGAIACFAGVGVGVEVAQWVTNSGGLIGFGPFGQSGQWCLTDTGHMFAEGSASCVGSIAVDTPGGTIDQIRDQFVGTPEIAFDPRFSYVWEPADPEEACALGYCIDFMITEYTDELSPFYGEASRGVSYHLYYTSGGSDPCPTYNHFKNQTSNRLTEAANLDDCISVSPVAIAGSGSPPTEEPWGTLGSMSVGVQLFGSSGSHAFESAGWSIGGFNGYSFFRHEVRGNDINTRGLEMQTQGDDPFGSVLIMDYTAGPGNGVPHWIGMQRSDELFEGQYEQTTACRAEDGTITIRQSSGIEDFVIGAAAGTLPSGGCLPGEIPVSMNVELCDTNSTACIPVADWSMPVEAEPYMECIRALSTPNPCPMWLEYWDGSSWEECVPATAGPCTDWWTNPGRDVLFRCGWGGDFFSASQCEVLKTWYNVDSPDPETDIQPVNPNDPADPGTDAPVTNPDPDTGHLPGTIIGPGTPPAQRPTDTWLRRIVTEWATGSTPNMQGACWPQGWGLLNPLQWVMRPIMCALTFLFVPTQPISAQLDTFMAEATTATKLGIIYDSGALLASIPSPAVGGACGWGIPTTELQDFTVPETQLIMCPGDYGLTAQASTTRTLGFGVVGLWVAGMVYRWIGFGRSDELMLDSDNVTGNL